MSARDRGRRSKPLKRKTAVRSEKVIFRLYLEGEATQAEYITLLRNRPEVAATVDIGLQIESSGAVPLTLVERARDDKEQQRSEVDHYWCVFDVESPKNHPHLHDAVQKARAKDIGLAISNPCFELWLVLHHKFHNGYLTTDQAIRLRRDLDGSEDKHLDADRYMAAIDEARRRAARLRHKHEAEGTTFPENNPSSSMDLFVEALWREVERRSPGAPDGLA